MIRPGHDLSADRERAHRLIPVSRETESRLESFVALLLKWQETTNLVSPSTVSEIWTRHIADSLQLLPLAEDAGVWIDLGSGGGFPGLVIACALADKPGVRVHLVESNQKKAAFLREAARALSLPVAVHPVRIGDFLRSFDGRADVVTARALAPLARLLADAYPLLKTGTKGLFLKGQDIEAELTEAAKYWTIQHHMVRSKTSESGHILVVTGLEKR